MSTTPSPRKYNCINKYPEIREFIEHTVGFDADKRSKGKLLTIQTHKQSLLFDKDRKYLCFIFLYFNKPVKGTVNVIFNGFAAKCLILPTCSYIAYLDTRLCSCDTTAQIIVDLTMNGSEVKALQLDICNICIRTYRIDQIRYDTSDMAKPVSILGYFLDPLESLEPLEPLEP